MGSTRLRRPPAPTHAERARSVVLRGGPATVVGSGAPPAAPVVHHVRADGSAVLLLDDDEPVLGLIRDAGPDGYAAMLEITDHAPVDLREPVRGLLWITGPIGIPDVDTARGLAMGVAEVDPDPELLRLGHGATLARLEPGSVVLSDVEGTAALAPFELAGARPDPFCRYEQGWLSHLELAHPDVLRALARHLPTALRDNRDARIRPLGMDRCGLQLRVETGSRDHDVRLAWQREPATVEELRVQMGALVGCPVSSRGSALPAPGP